MKVTTKLAAMALSATMFAFGANVNGNENQVMTKKTLTVAGAKRIAAAIAAEAARNQAGGAIAIVDDGGNLIYLERLENTFAAGAEVATGKARTAALFRRQTRDFEDAIKNGRLSLLGVGVMTPLQGGVPVMVEGQVVGAVGVSGAASAQQDEEFAKVGAAALQ